MLKIQQSEQQNPNKRVPNHLYAGRELAFVIRGYKDNLGEPFYAYMPSMDAIDAVERPLRGWLVDNRLRWGSVRVDEEWLAAQITCLREDSVGQCLDALLALVVCAWLEFVCSDDSGYDLYGLVPIDNDPPIPHEFETVDHIPGRFHVVSWDAPPPTPNTLKSQIDDVISLFEQRLKAGSLEKFELLELIPLLHRLYRDALGHVVRNCEVRFNAKLISQVIARLEEGSSVRRTLRGEEYKFVPHIYEGIWLLAFEIAHYHKCYIVNEMVDRAEISLSEARNIR